MAVFVEVNDPGDAQLRDYVHLRDVSLRKLLETERGIFIAEGEKVVRRALESGNLPRSFLMSERWLEPLADLLAGTDAPCYVLSDQDIESLTGFHVHRGALAAMERPALPSVETVLRTASRVVVIEDVMDHTNIGAIFRSAAALGFDAVVLSPRCADPLYRRSIKVSMGAVFWLPYARIDDWYEAPQLFRDAGYTTLALTLADDAVPIDGVEAGPKVALLAGSEGHGLSTHWSDSADQRVVIPMRAEIDSLNVAAAVAVACWQLRDN